MASIRDMPRRGAGSNGERYIYVLNLQLTVRSVDWDIGASLGGGQYIEEPCEC